MKSFFVFLLFSVLLSGTKSWAEGYRRAVEFEWEEIEGAKNYDVELIKEKTENSPETETANPVQKHKTTEAKWSGQLKPGTYKMRLRSRDYRGVPGEWSAFSEFPVQLEKVVTQSPAAGIDVKTDQNENASVIFQWSAVGGATSYSFELNSKDGETKYSETLSDVKILKKLPVAKDYTWTVRAFNTEGITSAEATTQSFILSGKKITSPEITRQENQYVREIRWQKPDHAQKFDIVLLKMDLASKKLVPFKEWKDSDFESIPFENDWDGGIYQISIRALAENRPPSAWSRNTFRVQNGDRSPAAEYVATVRKSIDRVTGWYAIASYLITEITYRNTSADKNTFLNLNAIGGTGRLGMGWFNPASAWGFLGIADFSGFTVQGKTHSYMATELSAIYRISAGDRAEVRFHGGGFFKEFPELSANGGSNSHDSAKVVSSGPHLGAELWYSLTPKMGVQLHAHTYASMFGIETPNGQQLSPSLSTQFGVMGSYRFTKNFTGLLGFTMREDQTSYLRSTDSNNTQFSENKSKISGNYMNIYAEWAF